MKELTLEELVSYCKNYGFVFQGSEIYGGLANSWDFGPLGVLLKNNIKALWTQRMVQEDINNVGLDSAILMNPEVWVATGHVGGFSDPLTDCKKCNTRHRADKLIEDFTGGNETGDGWSDEELLNYLNEHQVKCPVCGSVAYTPIRKFNLMFKTSQGVVEDSANTIYMRPETAQGIFVQYKNIQRSMRKKLPFGVGQIGKVFRNEITPGNFIFRVREFEQMEMEFFCKPGTEMEWYSYWINKCMQFLYDLGINKDSLRLRAHDPEELAFYSNGTTDIEYKFPWGFGELWGIASRTNYDLGRHQEHSKVALDYLDPDTNEKYIPYVVEPSVGVERLFLVTLFNAYDKELLESGEEREVLRLHPALAPYKVAVLPLIKKRHAEKAVEVYKELAKSFVVTYDETQQIGKRYRRQDAIGTPFCITVDDQTIEAGTVTVRNRDTMLQDVVKLEDLESYIASKVRF